MRRYLFIVIALLLCTNMYCQEKEQELIFVEKMPIFSKECADLNNESKSYECTQIAIQEFVNLFNPFEFIYGSVEGMIYIGFVIDIDGSITDIEVLRGFDEKLDKAALEHFENMPDFYKPGYQNGIPVKVRYTVPVKIKI